MLRLLSDENFSGPVIDGLLRREPELDLVRVQDVGLCGKDDLFILEWAAAENRVLLTHDHDVETVPSFAYQRIDAGLSMSGVLIVHKLTIAKAIEAILFVADYGVDEDVKDQVRYLPL